jgi:hypothetical protein
VECRIVDLQQIDDRLTVQTREECMVISNVSKFEKSIFMIDQTGKLVWRTRTKNGFQSVVCLGIRGTLCSVHEKQIKLIRECARFGK